MTFNIEHNAHQFFIKHQDGQTLATLDYVITADHDMDITHTFVDPALRGQGAARALFDAAVAYARQEQYKIIPTCPYIQAQFDKDPSLHDLKKQ